MTGLKLHSKCRAGLQNHAVWLPSLHWAEKNEISAEGTAVSSGGGEAGERVMFGNCIKTFASPTHLQHADFFWRARGTLGEAEHSFPVGGAGGSCRGRYCCPSAGSAVPSRTLRGFSPTDIFVSLVRDSGGAKAGLVQVHAGPG